jgi:hypothetical protein
MNVKPVTNKYSDVLDLFLEIKGPTRYYNKIYDTDQRDNSAKHLFYYFRYFYLRFFYI